MIISASRRSDLPAYHADWLIAQFRAGGCDVPNPYNSAQKTFVKLAPETIAAVVFWTRNAAPFLRHLEELESLGFKRYYFQYTLLDYPPVFEPCRLPLLTAIEHFRALARRLGPARVVWRYDPLIFSNLTPPAFHVDAFSRIAEALAGYTRRVVVSLLDLYGFLKPRLAKLQKDNIYLAAPPDAEISVLLQTLAKKAAACGMEIFHCAEAADFSAMGIRPGKCVDDELIKKLFNVTVPARKDPAQRKLCRCVVSRDIGQYGTCRAGCIYCYASRREG